jgi:CBS domain-containing protein
MTHRQANHRGRRSNADVGIVLSGRGLTLILEGRNLHMRCGDIMKKDVVVVDRDDTIQVAARRMRDSNVGFLPICEHGGKVVGTVTDRDIAVRVAAEGRSPTTTRVEEIMTQQVVSCQADDDLVRAEALMAEHHKSRIVVTNAEGYLQGVLSLSDVVQLEGPRRAAETIRKVTSREARF